MRSKSIPDKSIPGKSIPGKSIPGKSIPGKSIPGKSIQDKSIPGKSIRGYMASSKSVRVSCFVDWSNPLRLVQPLRWLEEVPFPAGRPVLLDCG
jgi:hypothetical protein